MPALVPNARQQFLSAAGTPLAGGKVYTYAPGSTSPKNTYQDPKGNTLNTNPIVLDSAGTAEIFGSGLYRQMVYDASGVLIWDDETGMPFLSDITSGQVLTLSASTTLTAEQSSYLIFTTNSSPITLTLPAPVAGLNYVIYGSIVGTVAVTASSGAIFLPDLSSAATYTIPASSTAGIVLIADGANWRARTWGQEVIANATAANQAVALGQFGTAGVVSANPTGINGSVSYSLTAPSNCVILINGNVGTAGTVSGFNIAASNATVSGQIANWTSGLGSLSGVVTAKKNASVTITETATLSASNSMSLGFSYCIIPSP